MVAADGAAGIVNAGTYLIAVAFETTSGFITPPGPKIGGVFTPTTYTSPGTVKINLSVIPIGPAGTAKRRILITQAGLSEYFFLGSAFGGIINDNVTTTAVLNFDDTTDLVESADFLFDLLETIPAPLGLAEYSGRLCIFGNRAEPSFVRASRVGEGEAFDSIDSIVFVNKDDGFSIRNATVIRDVLYSFKNLGIYSIRDTGNEPSTWIVSPIDKSINVSIHGIGEFFDLSGITMARDWTLLADRSGILLFDGIARKPPITTKIDDIWQTLNFTKFHKLVVAIDEQNHKIYCAIPTGSATENNKLIMGDYNLCPGNFPEASKIKWSLWEFKPGGTTKSPSDIGLFGVPPDTVPTLKMGSIDGGGRIWRLDCASSSDSDIGSLGEVEQHTDNFNRANAEDINTIWTGDVNTAFSINSNQLLMKDNATSIAFVTAALDLIECYVKIDYISGSQATSQRWGVVLSYITTGDKGYSIEYINSSSDITVVNRLVLRRRISGVDTILAQTTLPDNPPFGPISANTLKATVEGPLSARIIKIYRDLGAGFVLVLSFTDTTGFTVAGKPGIRVPTSTTGTLETRWDNFSAGSLSLITGDIESYFETSLLYWEPGNVHFFTAARLRITGSGTLLCTIRGEDDVLSSSLPSITLATTPGREFLIRFNFQNEKARIKHRLTTGRFVVSKLEIFGKSVYSMRPA